MPIRVKYLDDGGVYLKGTGCISFGDVVGANRGIYKSHKKTESLKYQIADYSAVIQIDISSEEVEALARQDAEAAKHHPGMLIAVVGKNDLVFGLLRMWGAHAETPSLETNVFRDVKDAKKWISEKLASKTG